MTNEMAVLEKEEAAIDFLNPNVVLLAESQLAFVGGGIGTVTVA